MNPGMFTKEEIQQLREGKRVVVGNNIYMMCHKCYCVVKLNKWLIGDLHVCEN